jgi:hypothetical protein
MQKFISRLLTFLLFSSIVYIILLFVWGTFMPAYFKPNVAYKIGSWGHMFTRLKELKTVDQPDILFLGSSHAYRGFDTRIFEAEGYRAFNLGSSAQTPLQTLTLIKRYFHTIQPRLIVYEVYPFTFSADGVESSLDIIANDKNDIFSYEMALRINHIKTWNSLLYGSMRDLLHLDESFEEPIQKGEDTYVKGGYVETALHYYEPEDMETSEIRIDQAQLDYFAEVVREIKKREIPLILVYAPIPKVNYSRYTNNSYFDSLMTTYAEYYNFNEIMTVDDSLHFYDSHHLNQIGVERFNNKFIEVLRAKGR